MRVFVVSKSANPRFALSEDNIIEVTATGPNPLGDAKSYAFDHTRATDESTFVYEADIASLGSYQVKKEVVFRPKQD